MAEELWQAWQVGNEIIFTQKRYQAMLCFFVPPDLPNTHLLMRIPFLKILAVSWVSPNSWMEMEPSWAWMRLKQSSEYITVNTKKGRYIRPNVQEQTYQFTFISVVLIFPWKGNLRKHIITPLRKKCLELYYKTVHDVISDLMVSLFLSLFKVFKGLFSFTLNWMSLNSLLFDSNSI